MAAARESGGQRYASPTKSNFRVSHLLTEASDAQQPFDMAGGPVNQDMAHMEEIKGDSHM